MIGRAAQGQPWLCGQIAEFLATGITPATPPLELQHSILCRHVSDLHQFYGELMGVRIARKHVAWYLQDSAPNTTQRQAFNQLDTAHEQLDYINNIFHSFIDKELAA